MSEFEQWFKTTSAYRMLESMNYYKMDLFHWVEARGEYRHTSVQIAFMTWAEQQAKIDQLKTELALCREENKGLVGKASEQKKRVGFAFTEFEMFAGYLCEHQPQGGDFITETLLMHGRVLKALRGEHD